MGIVPPAVARARWNYWWGNATTPTARGLRRLVDGIPGTRIGWDSSTPHGGPPLSYAGVRDGTAHALAPMELWRQPDGPVDVRRSGGRLLRTSVWAARPDRGDLLVLGLYENELAGLDLGPHLVGPLRVHYLIHLDRAAELEQRFGKKDRENLRRGARKHGWRLEIAREAEDFDLFFDGMHVPTMTARHGGWVRSERRDVAEHALFRRGILFFLRRGDERVAGVVCRVEGDTLVIRLAGVRDGDPRHYRDGAQLALYHLVLRWAVEHGIGFAELSGSRPFVSEGLFTFKRKFRPHIVVPRTHFARKRLVLAPRRDTPEVRDFLWNHPMITIDEHGDLEVAFPFDRTRQARTDLLWQCPGIRGAREVDLDELLAGLPGREGTDGGSAWHANTGSRLHRAAGPR